MGVESYAQASVQVVVEVHAIWAGEFTVRNQT
jgi:hypothetical protein